MDLAKLRVLYTSEGLSKLNTEFVQIRSEAEKNFGAISHSAGLAMTATGVAITGALGLAAKSALDFEKGMRDVGTLGVQDLQALREGVLDYSVAMGQDATAATKDLYQILSKGVSEANALDVLTSSAKGAAAGVGQVSDALDLGTSILNSYNHDLIRGASYVDKFENVMGNAVTAVKLGSTTIGDMGSVIGRVAPIASQAGVSINELFAAIAGITSTGTQTAEAISGLKAAISNVISPSESAKSVAQALGIQFDVAALKAQGLHGFLKSVTTAVREQGPALYAQKQALGQTVAQLEQAAGGQQQFRAELAKLKDKYGELKDVEEDELATMAALFGSVEGLNSVLALTSGGGADKFEQALKEMDNGAKTLNETFEAWKAQNPEFAYRQAKEAIGRLGIEIGTILLPALRDAAKFMLPVIEGISNFVREHQTASKVIFLTAGALGAFMLVTGPVLMSLTKIITMWKTLSALSLAPSLGSAAGGLGAMGKAASMAGSALGMIGPHLLVIGAAGIIMLPVIAAVVNAFRDLKEARAQEQETHEAYMEAKRAETRQWAVLGVEIDKVRYNQMSLEEQRVYWLAKEQEFIEKKRAITATMTEEEIEALNKRLAAARKGIEEEQAVHDGSMAMKNEQIAATQGLAAEQNAATNQHLYGVQQAGAAEYDYAQQNAALANQQIAAYQQLSAAKREQVDSGLAALDALEAGESEATDFILEQYGLRRGQEQEAMALITQDIEGALGTQTGLYYDAANEQADAARSGGRGIQQGMQPGVDITNEMRMVFQNLPPDVQRSLQQAGVDIHSFSQQAVYDFNQVTYAAQQAANWSVRHSPSILDLMSMSMTNAQKIYSAGSAGLVNTIQRTRNEIWGLLAEGLRDMRAPATFEQALAVVAAQTAPYIGPRTGMPMPSGSTSIGAGGGNPSNSQPAVPGGVTVNINGPVTVRNDQDIQQISERLAAEVRRDMQRAGRPIRRVVKRTGRIPRRIAAEA